MPIMIKDGKVLIVDNKVALSQNCCCGGNVDPCNCSCVNCSKNLIITITLGGCINQTLTINTSWFTTYSSGGDPPSTCWVADTIYNTNGFSSLYGSCCSQYPSGIIGYECRKSIEIGGTTSDTFGRFCPSETEICDPWEEGLLEPIDFQFKLVWDSCSSVCKYSYGLSIRHSDANPTTKREWLGAGNASSELGSPDPCVDNFNNDITINGCDPIDIEISGSAWLYPCIPPEGETVSGCCLVPYTITITEAP